MTKSSKTDALVSRRKMLGRIGILAAVGYTVPAFTTLSMAQAGSSASAGGSAASSGASASGASNSGASNSGASNSTPSNSAPSVSVVSIPSGVDATAVETACGAAPAPGEDPTVYNACVEAFLAG